MKKQIILAALVVASAASSFGQGYFLFQSNGKNVVWDNFTAPGTANGAPGNVNVAFLWNANALAASPFGASENPTNSPSAVTPASFQTGGWTLAQNAASGLNAEVAVNASGLKVAGYSYNGGAVFGVTGTAVGSTYELVVIGWQGSAGIDPVAALAAGAAFGWSNPFVVSAAASNGTPLNFTSSGARSFGVSPVPEPATFALAGLGMAAMLIARRRK